MTVIERARDLLVGRLGVIRRIEPKATQAGDPQLFIMASEPTRGAVLGGNDQRVGSAGIGTTEKEAFITTLGEAVERWCSAHCPKDELVFASADELGDAAVGIDAFRLFDDAQYDLPGFPFVRFYRDRPIHWARARALADGAARFVPAALVYLPFAAPTPDDELFHSVSTGQACHSDPARARLTGLFEVIERDAFMITWLRGLRVPEVDWREADELRALADGPLHGLELRMFDMTSDLEVPSYLCLAIGRSSRGTMLSAGAATRSSPRQAARKAMLEAAHAYCYARNQLRERPDWRPAEDFSNIWDFEDHVRFYAEPSTLHHADFLLQSTRRVPLRPEPAPLPADEELARSLAMLRARSLEALEVELTTPEIAQAGLFVTKIFVPGAAQLTAPYRLPALGPRRLFTVPAALGYCDAGNRDLNLSPHPFP